MNAKEIFQKVKALFDAPGQTVITETIVTPVTLSLYKLKDGTEISISGATIEIGAKATLAGVDAPAGEYVLEDGKTITVDGTGAITLIITPEPVTQPDFVAPATTPVVPVTPAPVQIENIPNTPEAMRALYAAFAVGTPEERLSNLELVAKALMEYSFGWQIREAEQKATSEQAINIYRQGLTAATQKIDRQEEIIKGFFELVEKLVDEPKTDPKTVSAFQKEKIERRSAGETRREKMASALKEMKSLQ